MTNHPERHLRCFRLIEGPRRAAPLAALLGLLIGLNGCSRQIPTYAVEGQLEFEDGTKPMFGDIEFYNAEHHINARGKIQRDGSFSVGTYSEQDGAIAGSHQIVIIQNTGDYFSARFANQIKHDHGQLVDPAYRDYRTSDLTCQIAKGVNRIELTLRKHPNQTEDGLPRE